MISIRTDPRESEVCSPRHPVLQLVTRQLAVADHSVGSALGPLDQVVVSGGGAGGGGVDVAIDHQRALGGQPAWRRVLRAVLEVLVDGVLHLLQLAVAEVRLCLRLDLGAVG